MKKRIECKRDVFRRQTRFPCNEGFIKSFSKESCVETKREFKFKTTELSVVD